MTEILPPRLEGTVHVGDDRHLSFAEFGAPDGRPVVWLHGTPGSRRQIPVEARALAIERGLRLIGVDRPGIGRSTSHLHASVAGFTDDLSALADGLGLERIAVIGLSGGGPYALAAGAGMPDRVVGVVVLGGVAPTVGPDAVAGGLVALGKRMAPLVSLTRVPSGYGLTAAMRLSRPIASPALDLYARLSPAGDRALLRRPEFKAMFLDDLFTGSRRQLAAPFADILLFGRHWGFDLADVAVPVRWWHGDEDHIVPFAHGRHCVARLPDAELTVLAGESHLGGLGVSEDIVASLDALWADR
ncbi:alpha/beta hydrolase [Iamia majanohamensis]|uniref:Alpha/beta hydrolase n=1 Tax=Iamia majanohamensis TaxID=467976 RepID=A0AAF0BUS8_9ACTN|nr:alpha/beta hydrolase [Iamia majanohamensis]WCO66055.1 alpha/beta hydrolase [Iamia majanohamensis]